MERLCGEEEMNAEAWKSRAEQIEESVNYDEPENCYWVLQPLHFTNKEDAEFIKNAVINACMEKAAFEEDKRKI